MSPNDIGIRWPLVRIVSSSVPAPLYRTNVPSVSASSGGSLSSASVESSDAWLFSETVESVSAVWPVPAFSESVSSATSSLPFLSTAGALSPVRSSPESASSAVLELFSETEVFSETEEFSETDELLCTASVMDSSATAKSSAVWSVSVIVSFCGRKGMVAAE